uniref:Uncharacterized protein n=1 Tax=viral metagenome TaxID=1070528 RepID=A0A6C0F7C3_9ZZZZ
MSSGGTQINDLINNTQAQSKEDNNVVDSIINELNEANVNSEKKNIKQPPQQQPKPRMNNGQPMMNNGQPMMNNGQPIMNNGQPMTPQQQQMYQQQMYQQQMYQQQMAAQQQKMMANNQYKGYNNNLTFADNVKSMLGNFKDVISVLTITVIMGLDTFSEPLKLKDFPTFYDIQTDKSKFPAILLKGLIIAILFSIVQYFTK